MFPIIIKSEASKKDLDILRRFMLQQPQYYPNFETWVNKKCIPNIEQKNYNSLIIISNVGTVIGDAIYTKLLDNKIKIKNFRIDPDYRNRDLGHFLLKQIAYQTENAALVLDVTVDNYAGVEFFIRNGFNIIKKERLYLPNQDEYIMVKN